ncbi:hypothetical protein [Catenulispora subtropica]|uniref:Uncharacterized protein n=1 Tax=Catenulispora subtropica TaxID=450798 RepID=A0ABP5CG96_9ACTN
MGHHLDPESAAAATEEFVLAYFPDDMLLGGSGSGTWDLYRAGVWSPEAKRTGVFSFVGGIDTGTDQLRDWLQDGLALGGTVTIRRSLYWVTADSERRVFPAHHVGLVRG